MRHRRRRARRTRRSARAPPTAPIETATSAACTPPTAPWRTSRLSAIARPTLPRLTSIRSASATSIRWTGCSQGAAAARSRVGCAAVVRHAAGRLPRHPRRRSARRRPRGRLGLVRLVVHGFTVQVHGLGSRFRIHRDRLLLRHRLRIRRPSISHLATPGRTLAVLLRASLAGPAPVPTPRTGILNGQGATRSTCGAPARRRILDRHDAPPPPRACAARRRRGRGCRAHARRPPGPAPRRRRPVARAVLDRRRGGRHARTATPTAVPTPTPTPEPTPTALPEPTPTATPEPTPRHPHADADAHTYAHARRRRPRRRRCRRPPPIPAPLTGVEVTKPRRERHPIAVMIDDQPDARPQSGFNAASVVWHAPAEGGIPRYMLVFQEQIPASSGRSAARARTTSSGRPRWSAVYVHAGGSPAGAGDAPRDRQRPVGLQRRLVPLGGRTPRPTGA